MGILKTDRLDIFLLSLLCSIEYLGDHEAKRSGEGKGYPLVHI